MKYIAKKSILFLIICLAVPVIPIQGKSTIQQTQTYETTNRDYKKGFTGHFDKTMDKNGKTYQLKSVKYKKIKTKTKSSGSSQTISTSKTKTGLSSQKDVLPNTVTYQGVSCKKTNKMFTQTGTKGSKKITKTVEGTSKQFPKTKTFSVTVKGQSKQAKLSLQKVSAGNTKSTSSETHTITVKNYDKGVFVFGGKRISFNDSNTGLSGETSLVKKQLGLSEKDTIASIGWSGKPYKSNNVFCRNIVVKVSRTQTFYTATYAGNVSYNTIRYTETAYYAGEKKGKVTVYECKAIATYKEKKDPSEQESSPAPTEAPDSSEPAPTQEPVQTEAPQTETPVPTQTPAVVPVSEAAIRQSPNDILQLPTQDTIVSTKDFQADDASEDNTTLEDLTQKETKTDDSSNNTKKSINGVLQYIPMILIFGTLGLGGYFVYKKIIQR